MAMGVTHRFRRGWQEKGGVNTQIIQERKRDEMYHKNGNATLGKIAHFVFRAVLFNIQSKKDAHNSATIHLKMCVNFQATATSTTLNSLLNQLPDTD